MTQLETTGTCSNRVLMAGCSFTTKAIGWIVPLVAFVVVVAVC